MRKKYFILFVLFICACVKTMRAEIIECVQIDNLYYDLNTETGTATLRDKETGRHTTSYYTGTYVIPECVEYNDQKFVVTAIAEHTFCMAGYSSSWGLYVTLPKTLREIGRFAFSDARGLTSIVIPEGVTTISYAAFDGCEYLRSVKLPSTLRTIEAYAFYDCYLTEITFPPNLKSIGAYAFKSHGFEKATIFPHGLQTIGTNAFKTERGNHSTYVIPSSVISIGGDAFYEINEFRRLYVNRDTPIDLSAHLDHHGSSYYTSVYVPCGAKELYEVADYWNEYSIYESCMDNSTLYNIEATAVNGSITGSGQYPYGTYVTLTAIPSEGYKFTQWSDGLVCNPRTEAVTADATYTAEFSPFTQKQFSKTFSISDTSKVIFSSGNLQYLASENIWCFAENQYDIIGATNENISSTYEGWIDLFGWGTSGYHNDNDEYNTQYYPYSTSTSEVNIDNNKYGYGPSLNQINKNLTKGSAKYDWGVYNSILNGGNEPNQWRTLTQSQWLYIINKREDAASKWFRATVNNVKGVVLLPDEYTENTIPYTTGVTGFTTNTFSVDDWTIMENEGAVFLPAAGSRYGTTYTPGDVTYHSTTYRDSARNYLLHVLEGNTSFNYIGPRCTGRAVRLVKDVEEKYTITTAGENGTIAGGGTYTSGATATLVATPNTCYQFVQWSDGNTDNPRKVTVNSDASYIATFEIKQYTVTTDVEDESQGSTQIETN